jgi:cellulose synthase/poly-beta-1,6-N-acetylglucosamine synthase-like glycosyltransferase
LLVVDMLLTLAAILYIAAVVVLMLFISSFGALLVIYFGTRRQKPALPQIDPADLPFVTVQLPIYNEAHVVERLLDACARLDYPRDKIQIQVLDDSTDETTAAIQRQIAVWNTQDAPPIRLIRRPVRTGYKAGALAYGLERVNTDYVAVFDADFVPPRDFLHRTLPYFHTNERLALVQTRWDHLNADHSALTRAQALTIDGHFVVEQTARSRGRLPMSMNGTGGVWRVAALRDAGGWSAATLTEDLDLSYRALERGWQFLYLPDVAVPGELPPQIQAYKRQQRRWATGMTECLIRHAGPLITSKHYDPGAKLMGLAHLSQFAVQPLVLLIFLLTPWLIWGDMFRRLPNLGIFGGVGLIPLLIMVTAQITLYPDGYRRLIYLPVQAMIGIAMALNNTLGVLAALHRPGAPREFKRTPKFSRTPWANSHYALRLDAVTLGEIGLSVYALWGAYMAYQKFPALLPYCLSYAASFGLVAAWNVGQIAQFVQRQQRSRDSGSFGAENARPQRHRDHTVPPGQRDLVLGQPAFRPDDQRHTRRRAHRRPQRLRRFFFPGNQRQISLRRLGDRLLKRDRLL